MHILIFRFFLFALALSQWSLKPSWLSRVTIHPCLAVFKVNDVLARALKCMTTHQRVSRMAYGGAVRTFQMLKISWWWMWWMHCSFHRLNISFIHFLEKRERDMKVHNLNSCYSLSTVNVDYVHFLTFVISLGENFSLSQQSVDMHPPDTASHSYIKTPSYTCRWARHAAAVVFLLQVFCFFLSLLFFGCHKRRATLCHVIILMQSLWHYIICLSSCSRSLVSCRTYEYSTREIASHFAAKHEHVMFMVGNGRRVEAADRRRRVDRWNHSN